MSELWAEADVARLVFWAMLAALLGGIAIGYLAAMSRTKDRI
jgi:hypothetical protein